MSRVWNTSAFEFCAASALWSLASLNVGNVLSGVENKRNKKRHSWELPHWKIWAWTRTYMMEGIGIHWMLAFPRNIFFISRKQHPLTHESLLHRRISVYESVKDKYRQVCWLENPHFFLLKLRGNNNMPSICCQVLCPLGPTYYACRPSEGTETYTCAWLFLSWVVVLPSKNSSQLKKSSGFIPPKNRSFQRRHLFIMETELWNKWLKIIWGTLTDLWWDFNVFNH